MTKELNIHRQPTLNYSKNISYKKKLQCLGAHKEFFACISINAMKSSHF